MGRVQSWLSAPLGARLVGAGLAVAGVALLLVGILALRGDGSGRPAAVGPSQSASPSVSGSVSPSASSSVGPTTSPAPPPTTAPPRTSSSTPVPPARAPVTVLNNSTVSGLGERVAGQVEAKGWAVPVVGNFAGRIPATTVYYTPGNSAEERAARALAADFPQIDRVYPRYDGLPPTPPGLVLLVTRTWLD